MLVSLMLKDYIKAILIRLTEMEMALSDMYLAIGDIGHNDSIARTRGVRKALGTGVKKMVNDSAPGRNKRRRKSKRCSGC